jgi:uncharacterized protein (TIGR03083 family)
MRLWSVVNRGVDALSKSPDTVPSRQPTGAAMDAAQPYLDALHDSNDRLRALVASLSTDEYSDPSYDSEWTIAHVLSHLGSQAEIFHLILDAGLEGAEPPSREAFTPIWDAWNAKDASAQVADSLLATDLMLKRLDALTDEERDRFKVAMFGMELDLAAMLRMRLNELALHTWDVEVARDPTATVPDSAAELLLDQAMQLARRVGRPQAGRGSVYLTTTAPDRRLELCVDPDVEFREVGDAATSAGVFTGEALLRLIAGRLDEAHVPALVTVDGRVLDELRQVFTGY